MTEAEWLACTEPKPMLEFLRGKASNRKLRLFAVACCRRVLRPPSADTHMIVEAAERHADGQLSFKQFRAESWGFEHQGGHDRYAVSQVTNRSALKAAVDAADGAKWAAATAAQAAYFDAHPGGDDPLRAWNAGQGAEVAMQCQLLKDIFGDPFRPVAPDPAWLKPDIVKLAQAIYDERAFDRLPILADALEEAGCTDAAVLGHLRGPGPHVRGCWVVDLLLGKE